MSRKINSVQSIGLVSNYLLKNISLSVISIANSSKGVKVRSFKWQGGFRSIINKEYERLKIDTMKMTE
jgi:hypothetical protein